VKLLFSSKNDNKIARKNIFASLKKGTRKIKSGLCQFAAKTVFKNA
jgi:hypothetical protein